MKFLKNNLIFILPVLSGILFVLAYPPYNLSLLALIGLIPLLIFINSGKTAPKKVFWGGFIFGFIFLGIILSWLFATAPFEWLGATAKKDIFLIFLLVIVIWLLQTIFLSLFFGAFSWILKKFSKIKVPNFQYLFIIPSLWILLEYLRAWGFGFFWLGKESFLGPHWTFGNLGYMLHSLPAFTQLADITGVYGISFLIIFVNTLLFLLFKYFREESSSRNQRIPLVILLILALSLWTGYGLYGLKAKDEGEQRKIALLQTNFPSSDAPNPYQKKEVFETILSLFGSPEFAEENPDFIISPEGFGFVSITQDKETVKYLLQDSWQSGQIFLENQKIIDKNGKIKSRLYYYDLEKEEPIDFHDKMLLVPGGDYLPYTVEGLISLYSFNIDFGQKIFQKGEKIEPANTIKGKIGGTICSSILSPNINRELTKKSAEFLVVVSSDAPFHGANSLLAQNLAMSKLRAVENRRYFAQATNMGYSFLINPKGGIVVKSAQFGNKILFSDIYLANQKTIYVRYGDWVLVLASIFILFSMLGFFHRSTFP